MPKKLKVSAVKEEPVSYDDVVKDVTEVPEETPEVVVEPPVENLTPVLEEPVAQTEKPKGTCEACGKTMTMKNLKYAHRLICPAVDRSGRPESFEELEDALPPPPKLVRSVTKVDSDESDHVEHEVPTKDLRSNKKSKNKDANVIKPNLKKSKSKEKEELVGITKKQEPAEFALVPPQVSRRSKAVEKAEKYEKLVANAL